VRKKQLQTKNIHSPTDQKRRFPHNPKNKYKTILRNEKKQLPSHPATKRGGVIKFLHTRQYKRNQTVKGHFSYLKEGPVPSISTEKKTSQKLKKRFCGMKKAPYFCTPLTTESS